jgi:cephalosporin hydroxylase
LSQLIDDFHKLYYDEEHRSPIINNTRWHGIVIQKCPLDLFSYSEIMYEVKPKLIVETGTLHGGSALWFAHMMDLLHGNTVWQVLSVDIKQELYLPRHPHIAYLKGSSIDPTMIELIGKFADKLQPVMVILDSDHRAEHVYKELDIYSKFVTPGSYLIVEDTDANGHPILPRHGPGPWEAVHDWLPNHPEFEIDKSREKFLMTCNPDGYLRRKA